MANVWGSRGRKAVDGEHGWRLSRSDFELRSVDDGDRLTPEDPDARFPAAPHSPPWSAAAGASPRRLRGRSTDDAWFERDLWGTGFLQLESGGTVILGAQSGTRASSSRMAHADRRSNAHGTTMPRPISLGEVLAWRLPHKHGITLPSMADIALSPALSPPPRGRPATTSDDRTVLSAAEGERFVLMHGDNYGCVERRDAGGSWQVIETLAEYMPAGHGRRYLRRVGEAYGEFQRRSDTGWESECRAEPRGPRLYLIDGRFEMLADAEYERRHGPASDSPPASRDS